MVFFGYFVERVVILGNRIYKVNFWVLYGNKDGGRRYDEKQVGLGKRLLFSSWTSRYVGC